jgi:hypothetical protein
MKSSSEETLLFVGDLTFFALGVTSFCVGEIFFGFGVTTFLGAVIFLASDEDGGRPAPLSLTFFGGGISSV